MWERWMAAKKHNDETLPALNTNTSYHKSSMGESEPRQPQGNGKGKEKAASPRCVSRAQAELEQHIPLGRSRQGFLLLCSHRPPAPLRSSG